MNLTHAEESYLIAIYRLSEENSSLVSTTSIAKCLHTSAASVTDMIQKLDQKKLILYCKYQGVRLSKLGKDLSIKILRKHLLWEVFLVDKLKIAWNEIHQIAEQLEHIQSDILIERLEEFLGHPYCSPHGVIIPNAKGQIIKPTRILLTEMSAGHSGIVCAVKDDSVAFLQYIGKKHIHLGVKVMVVEKLDFDHSMDILIDNQKTINVSRKVTDQIWISI